MIIITDANGNLVKNIPEKVYQGSNKANSIVFVAPLSASNTTTITYKLANKELSQPFLMTPYNELPTGYEGFNAWLIDLETYVTQYYGTVEFQIKSTTPTGEVVATVGSSFEVLKGVSVDVTEPSQSMYETIIETLATLRGELVNGFFESKGIYPYDPTFSYHEGVAIQNNGKIYISLKPNNIGKPLTNPTYWYVYDYATTSEIVNSIYEHNQNPQSHIDIRQSIAIVNRNIGEQIGTHNLSPNSHEDIRGDIESIENGTVVVEKANKDKLGNVISDYYQEKKPNGVANLIGEDGKIAAPYIPQSIGGGLTYAGTFNRNGVISATLSASELDGANISSINFADYTNFFFVSSETYTMFGVEYTPGDWAVCNGTGFDKIDSVQSVISVNGKIGVVNLTSQDVGALPNNTIYVVSINGQSGAVTITPQSIGATTEEYVNNKVDEYIGFIETVGFNGTLENDVITFTLDTTQQDFEFINNKKYVLDCRLPLTTLTGDLNNNYDIVFKDKNGNTINLNCIFQTNTNDTATVGDMCQIQNYNIAVGYSWRFEASYIQFVENATTSRVFYTDVITRETNPSMTGQDFFNAINNSKLKVGTTALVTTTYTNGGTTYLEGNSYLVTGEWVDGELMLGAENITPKSDFDFIELNVPSTATQGTITQEQLNVLQANDNNYIIFDHEIYRLNGKGHLEGYLTYTCVERETGVTTVKTITITTSMLSWALNSVDIPTNVLERIETPTPNDFVSVDANGNLLDSGVSKSNLYNPNLLINGDFRVNQRGQTSYTGNSEYCVDRWIMRNATVNVLDRGVNVVQNSQWFGLNQTLEDFNHLKGKVVTLTVKISEINFVDDKLVIAISNGTNASGVGTIIKSLDGITEAGVYTITATIPNTLENRYFNICIQNNLGTSTTTNNFTLEYVKLEIGNVATPFSPRPYGEELALCQRYGVMQRAYNRIRASCVLGGSGIDFCLPIPQPLRTNPTQDFSNLQVQTTTGDAQTGFSFATSGFGEYNGYITIRATKSSHGMTDATLMWVNNSFVDSEIY